MPISKEIELKLKARLEAGDAQAQAESVGMQIAQGIEKSFEDLGDRLVKKMLDQFKSGFSNFNWGSLPVGNGGFQGSDGVNVNAGFYGANGGGSAPGTVGIRTVPGQAPPTTNIVDDGLSTSRGAQTNPRSTPSTTQQTVADRVQAGLANSPTNAAVTGQPLTGQQLFGTTYRPTSANEEKFSTIINNLLAHKRLSAIDPVLAGDHGISNKDLMSARDTQKLLAGDSAREIARLGEAINKLSESIESDRRARDGLRQKERSGTISEDERKRLTELDAQISRQEADQVNMRMTRESEQGILKGRLDSGKVIEENLPGKELPFYKNRQIMGRALGIGASVAATGMSFMSDYSVSRATGAAGAAEVENFTGRQMMDKDYASVLATQQIGGLQSLQDEAQSSYRWGLGSRIVGGVGAGIGAVMSAGGVTALPGMALGATSLGLLASGAKTMIEKKKIMSDTMRQLQGIKQLENKEYMTMFGESSALAKSSFQGALGLGSDSYEDSLYGGGVHGVLDRSKESGLTRDSLLANQYTSASMMGSVWNEKNTMNFSGVKDAQVRANDLAGRGFYNAHSIAGAFYRGGVQRRIGPFGDPDHEGDLVGAYTRSGNLYSQFAGAEGIQQDYVPRMLDRMAAEGGRLPGAMDAAVYGAQSVISASQRAGGNESEASMQVRERVQGALNQGTRTGAGPMGMAKAQTVDKLNEELIKKTGKGLEPYEKLAFIRGDASAGSIEKILTQRGYKGNAGDTGRDMFQDFQKNLHDNVTNIGAVVYGDKKSAGVMFSSAQNIDSVEGMLTGSNQYEHGGSNIIKSTYQAPKPGSSPGREATKIDTTIDVTKAAEGFKTLGDTIKILNTGLPSFLSSMSKLANMVHGKSVTTQSTPDAGPKSE